MFNSRARSSPDGTRRGVNLWRDLHAILDNLGHVKHRKRHCDRYPHGRISQVEAGANTGQESQRGPP